MDRQPTKILIVLLGAIGDVTRGLSVATQIKRDLPNTKIVWAVESRSKDIVLGHEALDKVVVFERARGLKGYLTFLKQIRDERCDVVLDMQRHLKSGFTSFMSGAPKRIGFHPLNCKEFNWLFNNRYIERIEEFSPKIWQYQKFTQALGLKTANELSFGLRASDAEVVAIEEKIARLAIEQKADFNQESPRLALILGSTWPSRFWDYDKYVKVIETVAQRWKMVCLLCGGKGEVEIAAKIEQAVTTKSIINLTDKTTLRELVPLFSRVRIGVGSDSGPMHIASALGVPFISIFGSTSPKRSAPYGSEEFVLQSAIGCSPCFQRECPGLNTLCMKDIPAEAVVLMIQKILDNPCDK